MPAVLSPRRFAANRENAQHATGPRTLEGQQRSAGNAATHHLFSTNPLAPGESPADLHAFRAAFIRDLGPLTDAERFFADQAATAAWRLRRATNLAATPPTDDPAAADRLLSAETRLAALLSRALRELRHLQAARRKADHDDPAPDLEPAAPQTNPETPIQPATEERATIIQPPPPHAPTAPRPTPPTLPKIWQNEPTCHFDTRAVLANAAACAINMLPRHRRRRG